MNCESGSHNFRPFKRSRDLYCKDCGTVKPFWVVDIGAAPQAHRVSPEPDALVQPDPYLADAKEIIAQSDFEKAVTQILDANGAVGPLRDQLYAEAMSFGPALPLEQWFDHVYESVEKLKVETPLDEIIDDLFAE